MLSLLDYGKGNILPSHLGLVSGHRAKSALCSSQEMNLSQKFLAEAQLLTIWRHRCIQRSRASTKLWYQLCTTEVNWILVPEFRKKLHGLPGKCISSVHNKKGSHLLRTFKSESQVMRWSFQRHNKGVKFRQFVDGIGFVLPGCGHSVLGRRSTRLELGVGPNQALLSSRKRSHMQTLVY